MTKRCLEDAGFANVLRQKFKGDEIYKQAVADQTWKRLMNAQRQLKKMNDTHSDQTACFRCSTLRHANPCNLCERPFCEDCRQQCLLCGYDHCTTCSAIEERMLKSVIPKTGQWVSRIGFGSYRMNGSRHEEALSYALSKGVNIIDTASNFEQGQSEQRIGHTLAQAIDQGRVKRKELTIVTKSGYLSANELEGLNDTEYVKINDKSYHSMSPKVFEKQIERSLDRLQTDRIDIFMINSPERMLMAQNKYYGADRLYKDLRMSFDYLDSLVRSGTLGGYGLCSNTLSFPHAEDHVSLQKVIAACTRQEHLLAIQVPFNLFEREAVVAEMPTVAELARQHDLYVMTNRPLLAIANGQIRSLVNPVLGTGASEQEIMQAMSLSFEHLTRLESDLLSERNVLSFTNTVLIRSLVPIEQETLSTQFVWGQVLSENLARLAQNHFATRHYLHQQVLPAIERDIQALEAYASEMDEATRYEAWTEEYREVTTRVIESIVQYASIDTLRKNNDLDRILQAICPDLGLDTHVHSPLSVKVLRCLLSHSEVGTVFTGMRDPLYVQDAMVALEKTLSTEDLEAIWQCPL
ncbi:NADP-dependent oxidoreductase domain-containing protein [Sporodiniella umbellata]|nr:NADP-dependent oxidoreductase domain-containing protein [Sporodiniella umbellata]